MRLILQLTHIRSLLMPILLLLLHIPSHLWWLPEPWHLLLHHVWGHAHLLVRLWDAIELCWHGFTSYFGVVGVHIVLELEVVQAFLFKVFSHTRIDIPNRIKYIFLHIFISEVLKHISWELLAFKLWCVNKVAEVTSVAALRPMIVLAWNCSVIAYFDLFCHNIFIFLYRFWLDLLWKMLRLLLNLLNMLLLVLKHIFLILKVLNLLFHHRNSLGVLESQLNLAQTLKSIWE